MPILVYGCRICGTQVEKLLKSINSPAPPVISNVCPSCKIKRVFDKQATTAAIRTDSSRTSVHEHERSSQRTPQERAARMNNIKRGLTGDGRTPTNLKERSMQQWGSALADANPMPLDRAKAEIDEAKRSS